MDLNTKDFYNIINNLLETISELTKDIEQINVVAKRAQSEYSEVDKVTDSIKEITSAIDMLSLNASIEAARSGEHGKGFAVVANEVKNLSNSTKTKTEEIKKNINITASSMNEISKIASNNTKKIETINNLTNEVKKLLK